MRVGHFASSIVCVLCCPPFPHSPRPSRLPSMARETPAAETSNVAASSGSAGRTPIRRYVLPAVLFALGLFFQLVVLPSAFPPSHYDLLGVAQFASVVEVASAYEKLSAKWSSGSDIPTTTNFIKIRYAFELLTNPLWKRDYDIFSVDEQLHYIEKLKAQYDGQSFSEVHLPFLDISSSDSMEQAEGMLTAEDFTSNVGTNETWLIQVYSSGSHRCAQFLNGWKRISSLVDGIARTGIVELGEVQLASFLAERRSTGQPFFRNGLPAFVAFPPNCRSLDCYMRYDGDLSVDAIVDWVATSVLNLPQILYYSRESLVQKFIAKSGQHKIKVVCFSKTGERAAPFLRKAAKDYWTYAAFAFVLWREEDSSMWWNMLGIESVPAIVFLKDPGVKPIIYHGTFISSWFLNIMEQNKHQDLPQLRSATSMELGCDARGYSRAGNSTLTWYCVILAGRPSLELNAMREMMRNIKNLLMDDSVSDAAGMNFLPSPVLAANALKENRLTFTWLDGEAQRQYCFFYLFSENSYETCGPRRYEDPTDVPQLFIVRYKINSTENDMRNKMKEKSLWDAFQEEDMNLASQLVARYNGSDNIYEIIKWISQIIVDGDTRNLPYFSAKTPELIPEDKEPIWSISPHNIMSSSRGIKKRLQSIFRNVYDHMADPRLGPIFMLGACISFGTIWLQNSWAAQPVEKVNGKTRTRKHRGKSVQPGESSSITDVEPRNAYQLLSTDSDSE